MWPVVWASGKVEELSPFRACSYRHIGRGEFILHLAALSV